ncbi:hydroxyisourate hydrolase [Heyndrickxia ginsengihumi]|uniref:5-hydroxyisourate hydrolase n=1 Tax=Heyndrickxia ginsengihumi TaxID=363870 RepID=A0A0A6XXD7_9BACI|nr:hydroxyisourate hydrolase [Heyndrickxia ginsengihumi]KHD84772.1 5-hydroxyisourate hydrolase [Heyndrickxia ginsengihumi]MBE6184678.1 hydroxyisourate hydrolase [Bacillus sp. (in: firmicutes)]MCM3023656.1 hydroxyisourate hydrolase [Heyndrickxia ginsengihumi]NEY19822.1 hydroxyisourate hydrolase [Heyndrickxia ginsengihumi]
MTGITTHILDLTIGKPVANIVIELFYLQDSKKFINKGITNEDGRIDKPLLEKTDLKEGQYELLFHIGPYSSSKHTTVTNHPFLDEIPVRFNIVDVNQHYHIPLLISAWGYQIYRGS